MWSGHLVVSRLSSYSSSILSSTSRSKDQSNRFRKLGTLADPVATRSDRHACANPTLTDHDKQATGNREPANEMNKEDPTKGILVWFQPFTVNLEDLEAHVPAHSSEKENSDSDGDTSRVETSKLEHSVHAYFRKNQKMINSANRKSVVTWQQQRHKGFNEGRESLNNHRYVVAVQVLATQWNPCQMKTSQETEKNLRKFL